jgi:predicted aldo/keto reductase-like oxidoreductase
MSAMIYRRFGRTNLQIPVFSCGGMRYQYKWQDVNPKEIPRDNQDNLEATIRRSVEVGINHIETARGYGSSEMQLGYILPEFPREKIIVQTKIGPSADPKEFLKSFETSIKYLKLDYVDLLSVHGINNRELLDQTLRKGGCLDMARRIQKEGRCRHIGFATHADVQTILDAVKSDEFDYVNLHWYFIFQRNWPAVIEAAKRDMGVFIISPSDKGGMLYKPSAKWKKACEPVSPMIFNDLFCLSRPEVHTLSLGAARPSDFDEHVKALSYMPQAQQWVSEIQKKLLDLMHEAVGQNWWETFSEGLPLWDATPGNVNIPIILWLWSLVKGWDMSEYAKMRYNLLGNGGHWFPGNNASAVDRLDLASAIKNNPHRDKIVQVLRETHALLGGEEVKRLSQSD